MELEFALSNWNTLKASNALQDKLEEVVQGERPHAKEILFALLARQ